jgi:LPS sulfotransferase NodH
MEKISNYLICATSRSGSNYLCELLSSLGWAGRPEEHFWDPPGTEPEPLAARWPRVLAAGTGENGVFGVKLMWYQAERLERELPALVGMPDESLPRVLARALAKPQYVYLTRRDRLRQAISFVRAMQTKQWRSMDPTAQGSRYDPGAITDGMRFFDREEALWEDFFVRNGLAPYRLFYEDLDADPAAAVGALLAYLGREDTTPISLPPNRHQRQADDVTEEWIRRYHSEQAIE